MGRLSNPMGIAPGTGSGIVFGTGCIVPGVGGIIQFGANRIMGGMRDIMTGAENVMRGAGRKPPRKRWA
jgi:hypothetical protein